MLAFFHWLITFFFLTVILTLSLLNTARVPFDLSPFDPPVAMPLAVIILLAAVLGFVWGMGITWLHGWGARRDIRRLKRDLERTEKKRTDLEQAGLREHPETVISALLPPQKSRWPF